MISSLQRLKVAAIAFIWIAQPTHGSTALANVYEFVFGDGNRVRFTFSQSNDDIDFYDSKGKRIKHFEAVVLAVPIPKEGPNPLNQVSLPREVFGLPTEARPHKIDLYIKETSLQKNTNQTKKSTYTSDGESRFIELGLPIPPHAVKKPQPDLVYPAKNHLKTENDRLFWVKSDGEKVRLNNNPHQLNRAGGRPDTRTIRHNGNSYIVISIEADRGSGETYILRESDGKWIRIGNEAARMDSLHEKDGILELAGIPRAIDLDRFDIESKIQTKRQTATAMTLPYPELNSLLVNEKPVSEKIDPEVERGIYLGILQNELGSSVVLGEAGTGKTTLVKAIVQKIAQGKSPIPRTWRFLEVNPQTLGAGTGPIGEIEKRIQDLTQSTQERPTFIVMDEFHSMRGQGTHSENSNDVFQMLKPAMASGDFKVIAMDTVHEFYPAFIGDSALMDRINIVQTTEPTRHEEIRPILESWLKKHDHPMPDSNVLDRVIDLSNEFNATGAQPRKAIALLDRVYADLLLSGRPTETPKTVDIERTAVNTYHIRPDQFNRDAKRKKIRELRAKLDKAVVGQPEAKDVMVELKAQSAAGLNNPNKGEGSVLLVGPPGTGKTELSKSLAEALDLPFVKIEMNQYIHGKSVDDLLQEVAAALRKNAASVILFDELEKAHVTIQDGLLSLLDNRRFNLAEKVNTSYNGSKRTLSMSAKHATLLFTSNAGGDLIQERSTAPEMKPIGFNKPSTNRLSIMRVSNHELMPELKKKISGPLLDRFEAIAVTRPPSKDEFSGIIRLHTEQELAQIAKNQKLHFKIANLDSFIDSMADQYYTAGISSREVPRLIQKDLKRDLAKIILQQNLEPGQEIHLEYHPQNDTRRGCLLPIVRRLIAE